MQPRIPIWVVGGVAAAAPPWAKPGDVAAMLYLTANCGFWLTVLNSAQNGAARAATFLESYLGDDGRLPTFLNAHWLAAALWYQLQWQAPASRILDYLRARLHDLPAGDLAWQMTTLLGAGLPASHELISLAASLLEQYQRPDGSWPGEEGMGQDAHTTLEALRALRLCHHL